MNLDTARAHLERLSDLELRLKLRAIAEAALADSERSWKYVDGPLLGDVHVETRPRNPGKPYRSRIRLDPNSLGPFLAAASPGTILHLLDELDRLHARVEGLEATVRVRERERDAWQVAYDRAIAKLPKKEPSE